jgi:predicted ATP-grasp superfamily ATP-dependent carboligase
MENHPKTPLQEEIQAASDLLEVLARAIAFDISNEVYLASIEAIAEKIKQAYRLAEPTD